MRSKTFCSALLLIIYSGVCHAAQSGEKPTSCDGSTVDVWGSEQSGEARAFLAKLQSAVKADDKEKLASMLAYPVNVFDGDRKRKSIIHNRTEFLSRYSQLLTPRVKQEVMEQSSKCLFGNWQGAMIGDGVIWFQQKYNNGKFQIITFNLVESNAATRL